MNFKLFILAFFALFVIANASAQQIYFLNQTPANIFHFNAMATGGLTTFWNVSNVNASNSSFQPTISHLYGFSANTSDVTNNGYFLNGSYISNLQSHICVNTSIVNTIGNTTYRCLIDDNHVYPTTENLDEDIMENTPHINFSIGNTQSAVLTTIFNLTSSKNNIFGIEYMAQRASGGGSLGVWYCNSTYNLASSFRTNPSCALIGTKTSTEGFDHCHGGNNSCHNIITFINASNFSGIKITDTSYFIQTMEAGAQWRISYVPNVTRTNQARTTVNTGSSWTNLVGTPDLHVHQFNSTEGLIFYLTANSSGNLTNSTPRFDSYGFDIFPPSTVNVYSPNATTYANNVIAIANWTQSIDPNGFLVTYNSSLVWSENQTEVVQFVTNTTTLGYTFNTSNYAGNFSIRVRAQNNYSVYVDSFSIPFIIGNRSLNATLLFPENNSSIVEGEIEFISLIAFSSTNIANVSILGNFTGTWSLNQTNSTQMNESPQNYSFFINLSAGTYTWGIVVCDIFATCNYSQNFTLRVLPLSPLTVNLTNPANGVTLIVPSANFIANFTSGNTIINSTLWTNASGVWAANITQIGSNNFSQQVNFLQVGVIQWNVLVCDIYSCTFDTSANRTIRMVLGNAPNVTLSSPPNGTVNGQYVVFVANFTSDNYTIANSTLYLNTTGSWVAYITQTGSMNFTQNITLSVGAYIWNVRVCDVYNQCSFAPNNFTIAVAHIAVPPTVSLVSPQNNTFSYIVNNSINFTSYQTNMFASQVNATLWTNTTGTWQAVAVNTTIIGLEGQYLFNLTNIAQGAYLWNVYGCNSDGLCAFAPYNYTFIASNPILIDPQENADGLVLWFMFAAIFFICMSFIYSDPDNWLIRIFLYALAVIFIVYDFFVLIAFTQVSPIDNVVMESMFDIFSLVIGVLPYFVFIGAAIVGYDISLKWLAKHKRLIK